MYQIINKNTGKLIKSSNKSFFSNIVHIKLMVNKWTDKINGIHVDDIEIIEYELVEKSRKSLKEYL